MRKAYVAHDIKRQTSGPARHISWTTPFFSRLFSITFAHQLVKSSYIIQHVLFHCAYRALGQRLGEHALLAPMLHRVDDSVRAIAFEDVCKGVVVARFARIAFVAVDLLEAFGGVDGEPVRAEADDWAYKETPVNECMIVVIVRLQRFEFGTVGCSPYRSCR